MIQFSEFRGYEKVTVEVTYIYTRIYTTCGDMLWLVICPELCTDVVVPSAAGDSPVDYAVKGAMCRHLNTVGLQGLPSVAMPASEVQLAFAKYREALAAGLVPKEDDWERICEEDVDLRAMVIRSEVSAYRKKSAGEERKSEWVEVVRSCLVTAEDFSLAAD